MTGGSCINPKARAVLFVLVIATHYAPIVATSGDTTYACFEDAEERGDGSMFFTSFDMEIPLEGDLTAQLVGLRFVNIDVPREATIDSAFVTFEAVGTGFGSPRVDINTQRSATAGAFVAQPLYLTNLATSTATVLWTNEPLWSVGTTQTTPDLSPIVQEIIDLPGWNRFNSLAMLFRQATGSNGRRVAHSVESTTGEAARLTIRWTLPTPSPTRLPSANPTNLPTDSTAAPTREPTDLPTNQPSSSTPAPSSISTQQPTTGAIQPESFAAAAGVLGTFLVLECLGVGTLLVRRQSRGIVSSGNSLDELYGPKEITY